MKTLLLAAFSCVSLHAQLDLYLLGAPGVETPVSGRLDCGAAVAGDFSDLRLRIRNAGGKPELLRNVVVTGTGFSLENIVSFPYSIPAGLNVDFRVRFRPHGAGSYSGTLSVNDKSWFVSGRSPDAAALFVEGNGGRTPVTSSVPVDFGRIERGTASWKRFVLGNASGGDVVVRSLALEPGVFSIPVPPVLPLTIGAGAEAAFDVSYVPVRSGVQRATLEIDGRNVTLEGMAVEPPFPESRLTWLSSTVGSGEQAKIGIQLSAPSRAVGSGTLVMSFLPSEGLPGDAAVQFVASGSRELRVTVREGDTDLSVNGLKEIFLQTGTTAGRLSIRFELGGASATLVRDLPPVAVKAEGVTTARTSSGVQLRVTGFDNTRTLGALAFYFYDLAGVLIGGGPVVSDVTSVFRNFYDGSALGGVFSLNVQFPVQGDTRRIGGVEVEFMNSAGKSKTARASF